MDFKVALFDWGNTVMRDFPQQKGPMYLWDPIEKMPGVGKLLRRIYGKIDCYIATNAMDSSKGDIERALAKVDLNSYFEDIFCYKEIGFLKPSKEYFDWIVNFIGCDRSEIVMVGDSLENDVEGAKASGIEGILYDFEGRYLNYEGLVYNNFRDMKEVFK